MSKHKRSDKWNWWGIALVMWLPSCICLSGCAAAYHDYSDCRIPYRYCPPQPLPYMAYGDCHCPTPGEYQYFQQHRDSTAVNANLER